MEEIMSLREKNSSDSASSVKGIDYLRLSITDRCNLRCMYCAPLGGKKFIPHDNVLRYEEILRLVTVFVKAGIRKLRITGGEPLIKPNIVELIQMLSTIDGLDEIALTTNGVNLSRLALPLRAAGVDRINISIDSLQKNKFEKITGCNSYREVFDGLKKAFEANFQSVKINVVPMKGINDDEIIDFVKMSMGHEVIVRFIELFSTNESSKKHLDLRIPTEEVQALIQATYGPMEPSLSGAKGNGPAEYWRLTNHDKIIGFISNYSKDFCNECSRMRVNCSGEISPCLFSGPIYDARPLLISNKNDQQLFLDIKKIISEKSKHTKARHHGNLIDIGSLGG